MDRIAGGFGVRAWGGVKHLMRPLSIPLSGLSAQRARIETIATNLANAETTRGPNGEPYRRRITVLEPSVDGGVRVSGTSEDQSQFTLEYDPGHEDADEFGYVRRPNVNVETEIADMLIARRVFEANATVFDAAKTMLRRALDI